MEQLQKIQNAKVAAHRMSFTRKDASSVRIVALPNADDFSQTLYIIREARISGLFFRFEKIVDPPGNALRIICIFTFEQLTYEL